MKHCLIRAVEEILGVETEITMQCNESTDVSNCCQFLVFVCFLDEYKTKRND